ncbi:hypothetical protein ABE073_04410 [Lederbergia citrisecunda]|uniref:hypothetical protein n=1 Tax=Lederbergia citrisecunda TaxID=2833583 RepID=UPI003D29A98A
MDIEAFLRDLAELSKKHGLYIRARHEDDWWYAPLLVDSEIGSGAKIVLDSVMWNENDKIYVGDAPTEDDEDRVFRR